MTPKFPDKAKAGIGRQAVVIGGSMAGLQAARVLSDHFDRVIIIERDNFPDQPTARPGVPQARHIHLVLARGVSLLEQLFPGLAEELSAAGAVTLEFGYDVRFYTLGVWFEKMRTGISTRMCTRDLLEFTVRQRVKALCNVTFLEKREAVGLLATESKSTVIGIRARLRGDATSLDESIQADFVVDASGRNSRTPEWLVEMGYPTPIETKVNSFLGYSSRLYTPPANFTADWKALIARGRQPYPFRAGCIYPVEGQRWIVTLAGAGRDYPPIDEAGFAAFAQTLGEPALLSESLKDAQALGPAVGYQRTENRWRHYERLERWPENFIVLGDAACALNPAYGQGMTLAGLDALALDECLREAPNGIPDGLARRFQRKMARGLQTPWLLATSEDYHVPETEGAKLSWALRMMHVYIDGVTLAAAHDPQVFRPYFEVTQLVSPPRVLFSLNVILRVLIAGISRLVGFLKTRS